jgi:hypothetical protein
MKDSKITKILNEFDLGIKSLRSEIKAIENNPFLDLEVIHCLSENVTEIFQPPSNIVTLGHGPFVEYDFDAYLVDLKITPRYDGYPWIIVGREGWTENKLIELIEDEDLDEVVVFSQELFVAGIISSHNPFSFPEEILMKFARGHPALEFLIERGFEWPEIFLEELNEPTYLRGPRGAYEHVEESPLYRMGYRVGVTRGLPFRTRKDILSNTYHNEIPWVGDNDYMEEWGHPGKIKRLWRMAHHIAWLARSRQNNPTMQHAVNYWVEDLDWLKQEFGHGNGKFAWPNY